MYRPFILLLLLAGSLVFSNEIKAQQAQADTEQSLLPEIDPQDIEIRSQFQARFPGLRRQPILGFNPRPRVFQSDPNRIPFIEDEETVAASLAIGTLDRPEAPEYRRLGYADPKIAFFRGGVGSFISPEADAFAIAKLSDRNWLSGRATFSSSDGHEQVFNTSYRWAEAGITSYNRFSNRTSLKLDAGILSDFNHMPRVNTTVEELLPTSSKIEHTGIHGSAELEIAQTSMSGVNIAVSGFANDYSLIYNSNDFITDASEWGVNVKGEYSMLGNRINEIYRARLHTTVGSITTADTGAQSWSVSTLSAHYERLFNYRTDVKATLGLSGVTDASEDFTLYVAPEVEIKHTFFTGFSFRGKAYGRANHHTFSEVRQQNRFFDLSSSINRQYEMGALGEILTEPFYGTKILAGASFRDVSNYLYFSRSVNPIDALSQINEAYYIANFNDATLLKVYGAISQDLRPEILWVSADGYWQIPRLSGGDKIPFVENFSIKGTVSFRPAREVLIEGWGEFLSGRDNHIGENLSSFFTIGGKFEISISENFGVYGKILNILNEEYEIWSGYPERGFQAFVGFTYLL